MPDGAFVLQFSIGPIAASVVVPRAGWEYMEMQFRQARTGLIVAGDQKLAKPGDPGFGGGA